MPLDHPRAFGGGLAATSLSPTALVLMILAVVLILLLPRKYAMVPLLFACLLIPIGSALVLGGVHLYISRIVIFFGLARVLGAKSASHKEILSGGWNSIDRLFFCGAICQTIAVVLLFGDMAALINQVGILVDLVGMYLLLRAFVGTEDETFLAIKCLAVIVAICAVSMIIEQVKNVNVFYYLGGGTLVPEIRDGRTRSQAPFLHPLMAGTFGAMLVPVFVILWRKAGSKLSAAIGIIGAGIMTLTANSSTPLSTLAAGILALALWPVRGKMRAVRWGVVIALIALTFIMKAPVWFILAHVDLTGSSSGYHRAEVVDQFIKHFSDWFLIGVKDTSTWGWDMWDAQNQYVSVGEGGGLLALVLFVAMIVRCFSKLGAARVTLETAEADRPKQWILWCLGAALFANVVGFFGVNYYDQSMVGWLALLVMITAMTTPILQPVEQKSDTPEAYPARVLLSGRRPEIALTREPQAQASKAFGRKQVAPGLPR